MNAAPQVKGWCPGALRPMLSGDGWVVRVRPYGGRLTSAQATGIANLSMLHGNGRLDLSNRGNLQIRGVTETSHTPLINGLRALSLVDESADIEGRRNILVTPFWQSGDETEVLTVALSEALAAETAPTLPGKFGFALDTSDAPVLQNASADIRLERCTDGGLILVADGCDLGKPVTADMASDQAIALARWFMATRGNETRMAGLLANHATLASGFVVPRQTQTYAPMPASIPQGHLVALTFGQMASETLSEIAKHGDLRMTPWRMMVIEGVQCLPKIDSIITNCNDPLLRVVACTGAPGCTQALGVTRDVARLLAPHVPQNQMLHVSGCSKGCAHPGASPLTVTATHSGYDLIRNGTAADTPVQTELTPDTLIKAI